MPIVLTHCSACHALLNPAWHKCFVCGRHVTEPERATTPPASPSEIIDSLLTMPLDHFERGGAPMEIAVTWFDKTLWFVPGDHDAATLVQEGVSRGRIWTAKELIDLLDTPGLTQGGVTKIAKAKAIFEGTVTP